MNKRVTKLLAALTLSALLALMFFAVPPAEALERVCMRGNVGIGYVARFRVFWENDRADEDEEENASGRTGWSGHVRLAHSTCVDVGHVPDDSRVMVELREISFMEIFLSEPHERRESEWVFCNDWDNNPMGVAVAHPNWDALWLDAWGLSERETCKLWKYE